MPTQPAQPEPQPEPQPDARSPGAPVVARGLLVILGASGDLTKRLLMPALYNLACDGLLAEDFAIIGMSRQEWTHEEFRLSQREGMEKFSTRPSAAAARWQWLESRLYYTPGEFDDPAAYARLKELMTEVGEQTGAAGNTLLYLAISPDFFGLVNQQLAEAGFANLPGGCRLIVEKPFGKDLASARALNAALLERWSEQQIYRIDHYLGKETVQNLLAFRLANPLFAPLWNAKHIDHIQISATETVGVETRGEYYDRTGVVRDMLQNHLLQMLSYVCMEPPATLDPDAVREAKSAVLKAVRVPDQAALTTDCVRGQYGEGVRTDGTSVAAYRSEPHVAHDSNTETFAAIKLHIDNERWAGMPVYLRSGKSLWKRGTEIVVQFKAAADAPLGTAAGDPNLLIFHIQPLQGVEIRMHAKRPGPTFVLQRAGMRFDYAETFEASRGTGYEVLLYSALLGDPTLFSRTDFVENSWEIVQPVLDAWREHPAADYPNYRAGSWGPRAAEEMLGRDGRHWHEILNPDVLKRSQIFAAAPAVLLNTLLLAMRPLTVDAGACVIERGATGSEMYVACRGELEALGASGQRVGLLREGDCFGEMALLFCQPRSATVRALSPCDLLVLGSEDFRRIMQDFPAAEADIRRVATQRRQPA